MENNSEQPKLTKELIIKMAWCLGLALFWVVFIWGIFRRDMFALGFNAFVFWALTLLLFIRPILEEKKYQARDLYWIIPLVLIAVSYLIYDNPFIKAVNMLVYPALAALFLIYGNLARKHGRHWDLNFISKTLSRFFSLVIKVGEALGFYSAMLIPKSKSGRGTARKIVIGVILFLVIALTVIIPLLSSADAVFAGKMSFIYDWLDSMISDTIVAKIVVFIILAVVSFSALLAWSARFDYEEKGETEKKIDPIVTGIVIGGILGLYLLFLWVQVSKLWVGSLPFDFKETESLVKSGFWQLFFLSGLNVLVYFFTYRKTNAPVQKLLAVFSVASLLLLSSAGYRMALYVVYYGFSYEKFFASYTVVYSAVLFIWLITRLFLKERANIFKFLVFLFLWMYSIVTILPIEQFIFRANLALAAKSESRINLFELTMLSPDVLGLVKTKQAEGRLTGRVRNPDTGEYEITNPDWNPWIEKQEKRLAEKKWYEKNIMNFIQN